MLALVVELAFLTLFRETYKVYILRRKAAIRRKDTGDDRFKTAFDGDVPTSAWLSITRPAVIFYSSTVLQVMSVFSAFIFAFFYVMSVTLPDILESIYHFSPALTGAAFMSFSRCNIPESEGLD